MKHLKHFFALTAMLLCSTSLSAHDFEADGIYYNITSSTDNTVEVTYKGSSYSSFSDEYTGSVTVPESVTYNDVTYSVTSIGEYAFYCCTGLTSIDIPNSVTSIGDKTFFNCTRLTSINIPNSVTSIGNGTFHYCTRLKSINIPNSVTSIGRYAFMDTAWYNNQPDGLIYINNVLYEYKGTMPDNTSVEIKEGTESISSGAFLGCTGLTSINIPNSVTSIGEYAFSGCTGLTSINIPNSVTSIGYSAFKGCTGLTSINIPNSVTSIGNFAFYDCTGLTSINIPNSVTSIGEHAFFCCTGLTSIDIPNSVTSIGHGAFSSCSGLTSIEIPNSVTSIGDLAFSDCSGLTSIEIPNSVTSIGEYAFCDCTGLKTAIIGDGVDTLYDRTFLDCPNLTRLTIGGNVESIDRYAFLNTKNIKTTIWRCSSLPNGYSYAKGKVNYHVSKKSSGFTAYPMLLSAFESDGMVCVPTSMAERTCDVLYYNGDSASVEVDGTVTYRGIEFKVKNVNSYAFSNAQNIKDITLNVDTIGNYAIENCANLANVNLNAAVKSIGYGALINCPALESIVVDANNEVYDSRENCNAIIATNTNTLVAGCKSTVIPNSVISIGAQAFSGCSGLTNMTIPNSVKSIWGQAFENCTGLTSLTIPNSVDEIAYGAFMGCTGLTQVSIEEGESALSFLGSEVFASTPLDSVYIGRPISYSSSSYAPFRENTTLRAATISDKLTEVGNFMFYNCSALKTINMGQNISAIGNYAFSVCTALEEFKVGANVQTIGNYAFSGCAGIKKLESYATTPPVCGTSALTSIDKFECTLMVPEGTKDLYAAAAQWNEFLFVEETQPTAIEGVEMDDMDNPNAPVYNLHGMRMQSGDNLPKGIYIKSGKKFLVK